MPLGPTRRAVREQKVARINDCSYRPGRTATFAQFIERWDKEVLPTQAPSTVCAIRSHIRCYISPILGKVTMSDFGPENQQKFIGYLMEKDLSRKTIINVFATLGSILKTASDWKYVCETISIKKLKLPPREEAYKAPHFTIEQLSQILAMAEEPWRTLFSISAMEGLRPGEVLGLQWSDIDFERGVIQINRSSWRGKTKATKTEASETTIPMPEVLATILRNYQRIWKPNPSNFLFVTKNNRPPTSTKVVVNQLWPILDALKIPRCGLKAFRHSLATHLVDTGANIKVAQRQLRHTDSRTTANIYAHVISETHRNAVDAIAEKLDAHRTQVGPVN